MVDAGDSIQTGSISGQGIAVGRGAIGVGAGATATVYQGDFRPPRDFVRSFSFFIEERTRGFVGRAGAFAAIDRFAGSDPRGYFQVVAGPGLGKSALAAEVARRRGAIAFFVSVSDGTTRTATFLTHVCGELITRHGLDYDYLPPRAGEDTSFLLDLLRIVGQKVSPEPLWLVVDALDEAEPPPTGANPLLLPPLLPPNVYVLVTRRPGPDLIIDPWTPTERYVIRADDPEHDADLEAFVRSAATSGPVAAALASTSPPVPADEFVTRVKDASDGNFMYVSFVLADVASRRRDGAVELDALPAGLTGYYQHFVRSVEDESPADWTQLMRPTIERLAVAAEAVTNEWLARHVGRPAAEVQRAVERWQRLLSREASKEGTTWRLFHRSFAEFLAPMHDLAAANHAVASDYLEQLGPGRPGGEAEAWDEYGLRNVPAHLAAAARGQAQPARHRAVDELVTLVIDPRYQEVHLRRLRDPALLERDLVSALGAAGADDDDQAPLLAGRAALALRQLRHDQRRPEPIFQLAREGEAEAAARRLDLFALEIDRRWYEALLLILAWLALPQRHDQAARLRARVRTTDDPTLALLARRLDAAMGAGTIPALELPPAPPTDDARALVDRLGGAQGQSFLQSELGIELIRRGNEMVGSKGFLAEHDGPLLVATAAADPERGDPLLRRYLAIHSAYGYREYRQGSLWAMLGAVLRHPSQDWVRTWAAAVGEAALAPNRGEFSESLPLAVLAARGVAGDGAALAELAERARQAVRAAEEVEQTAGVRGSGDTWGSHKRRLAALAEALSRSADPEGLAPRLLDTATRLRFGFAGFHAPACLALAEAVEIAAPGGQADAILAAGLASAHNIQDATFCARTTSRVNAMRERWWSGPIDVAATAGRLADDPSAPAFAALHVVGERYQNRDPVLAKVLPPEMREARSLAELAGVYERPIADFVRLNADAGWEPDEPLPDGQRVNVPDPGFPPLLAARIAAAALADAALPDPERVAAIRRLVVVAANDHTALHTVLGRLVLAWRPTDPATLASLAALAAFPEAPAAPDSELDERLATVGAYVGA